VSKRLDEIEARIAYLEHYLEQLDEVVREWVAISERSQNELKELRQTVTRMGGKNEHERPPHYDGFDLDG